MKAAGRGILVVLAVTLCGCPPPPRPQTLDDLASMLDSIVIAQASPRAPDAVAAARATQAEAEAAWESGDLARCERLALLAQVQVRTAVALARQTLARERHAEAERALAEAEAAYAEIEARRAVLEERLARLWGWRRAREEVARERARAVEEEALRVERLSEAERAAWERNWRAQAAADAADARRTLEVARMLGAERVYPEAERMAREAVETAREAAGTAPWRIERPLVDHAIASADELRFRMLSFVDDDGAEAAAERVTGMVSEWRTGFDPPFHVALDPRGVALTLDAKSAEIEVAFPEPIVRALRDLRAKWTAADGLLCLVAVRSLDEGCGEGCAERTAAWAERLAGEVAGDAGARVRSLGMGFSGAVPPSEGVSRAGGIRVELLFFPEVPIPPDATAGHTEAVTGGSQ